ncbi:MAG: hypothetical protein ACYDDV_07260 [Methanoregula sp.]
MIEPDKRYWRHPVSKLNWISSLQIAGMTALKQFFPPELEWDLVKKDLLKCSFPLPGYSLQQIWGDPISHPERETAQGDRSLDPHFELFIRFLTAIVILGDARSAGAEARNTVASEGNSLVPLKNFPSVKLRIYGLKNAMDNARSILIQSHYYQESIFSTEFLPDFVLLSANIFLAKSFQPD